MKIEVQGGYEKGGYEFNVLETPATNIYIFESLAKFQIENDTYWHGYIKGSELKNKLLPLDANPRKPGPTKVVKIMQATIQKEPLNFHHLNNGITIIASQLIYDEQTKSAEITFGQTNGVHGDGVCNGGHTYFSLDQFKGEIGDELLVKVEILVLDPNLDSVVRFDKIKVIAEARNAHNELESITTAHYSGFYDNLISSLGTNKIYFKWYEGDPEAIKKAQKVDSLIAKITSLSPHWYSHYLNISGNTGSHMPSARNTGSIHKKWEFFKLNENDERNLDYLFPLINDILLLIDEISYSLIHDEFSKVSKRWRNTALWRYLSSGDTVELNYKLINGKKVKGYNLSHTFITMVLGAFRENVWFSMGDDGVNLVGWLINPIELWHKHKESFMRDLNNIAATINAPSFGNAFLQNAAIYNYQFTLYKFGENIRENIGKPEIIYELVSSNKYLLNEELDGEYWLEYNVIDEALPLLAEIVESKPDGESFHNYTKLPI
ncbi:MAG: hypothetical protein RL259_950 [Bacteroidota bacterium]|jgi:hypothetical protein